MTNDLVPVAEDLFTWLDDSPHLVASRHRSTGAVTFPADPGNPDLQQVLLSRTGRLWTWTTQEFVPPSPPYAGETDPTTFEPYAVGYVEFAEGILVEGRLTERDPERLAIGQQMEVVVVPFRTAAGQTVATFAFGPVAQAVEA